MSTEPLIGNISDTARWVAYYRAMETEKKDALFQDPYAKLLAGPKGEEIAKGLKGGKSRAWWLIVRTKVLDEVIDHLISKGKIDAVLNLAAGLDTRPYRLNLPKNFKWIEADLPGILDYKESKLAGVQPKCQLERYRCDLSDVTARQSLFKNISQKCSSCLVITEGLLIYLDEKLVSELAQDLYQIKNFNYWLLDFASDLLLEMINKRWQKDMAEGNSEMKFAPPGGISYFERFGWKISEVKWGMTEAKRLKREMPFGPLIRFFSSFVMKHEKREKYRMSSGFLLLSR